MTGVLYTYDSDLNKITSVINKGLFGEIIKNGKPMNSFYFFIHILFINNFFFI